MVREPARAGASPMALTLGIEIERWSPLLLVNSDLEGLPLNQALAEITRRRGWGMRSFLLCMDWLFETSFVHSPCKSRVIQDSFAPHLLTSSTQKFGLSLILMEIWLVRISGARGSRSFLAHALVVLQCASPGRSRVTCLGSRSQSSQLSEETFG
jgi:hypothetical protein